MSRSAQAACAAGTWAALTIVALIVTLSSLRQHEFDGLNNILQIPFALPWFVLPLPAIFHWGHTTDAWVTAGMGLLNSALIYVWLSHRRPSPA